METGELIPGGLASLLLGKLDFTKELHANSLFDVSHITAVVTGGGTGIGLSQ